MTDIDTPILPLLLIIRHNPIQKLELENYEPTISFLRRDS